MKSRTLIFLVVGVFLLAFAVADDTKDEAIKKDRQQIAGTWRIVAIEEDGKRGEDDGKGEKLTVVNGSDGTWSLRLNGKESSKGTSTFDPTKTPKTIDFTITEGNDKGQSYLGIYELGENARKLCFAQPGKERPTEFVSKPGSQNLVVFFQREKAK